MPSEDLNAKLNGTEATIYAFVYVPPGIVYLEAVVALFDIYAPVVVNISESRFWFSLEGRAFGGAFETSISVSISYSTNIVDETNALASGYIVHEANFGELEGRVNWEVEQWVDNALKQIEEIENYRDLVLAFEKEKEKNLCEEESCPSYYQCTQLPSAVCVAYEI